MPGIGARAVIFDLDGTLLDTLPDIARCINSVLEEHGFRPHPADAYRRMIGSGLRTALERALEGQRGTADVVSLTREVDRVYAEDPVSGSRFYSGVPDVLTELSARRVPMSILSNKPDHLVQLVADHFFGPWQFTRIVGHVDGMPRKPDAAAPLAVAEAMGAEPKDVIFLGDSDIDMLTAEAAGMMAVGAGWGFRGSEELSAAGASIVLSEVKELLLLV